MSGGNSGMAIGALAKASGVNIETIRYYERIGLMAEPARSAAGYRQYDEAAAGRLAFIRKGRDLGFSIDQIRALLRLAQHPEQPCADAERLAAENLAEIRGKIAQLSRLHDELQRIVHCGCTRVAECRIIDALGGGGEEGP